MFFKIVFFYMFLIAFETVSRWRCNIPPWKTIFVLWCWWFLKLKSDSLQMCSWRQPANRRGTQQTNALLQPTSFCVNWRNERSLTRLPSLSAFYSSKVLPWHDQKCETTGCKHDTHGPHTQLRMSSLKQTEERSQSLEPRPSGTGSVQKQHHSPLCTKSKHQGYAVCLLCFRHCNLDLCVWVAKNPSSLSKCFPRNRPWLDHGWFWVLGDAVVSNTYSRICFVSQTWRCTPYLICLSTSENRGYYEDIWFFFLEGRGKLATNY